MKRLGLAGLALLILAVPIYALPAAADGRDAERLSAADQTRLDRFDTVRAEAVAEAEAADARGLAPFLAGAPEPILGEDIRGDYRCRTAKLGGSLGFVAYGWFACRIVEDDLGYLLEKTSGSQRLTGHFIDESENRLLFWGADHYADEAPRAYGASADRNVVGYFFKVGDGSFRLEQPLPPRESDFDILLLERR